MTRHCFFLSFLMLTEGIVRGAVAGPDSLEGNRWWQRVYRYFEESNEVREERKFDFSVIGGPHYASDTRLGFGVVASGLYRLDRSDRVLPPSDVSLYGDVTTTGFYLLGLRGNTIFPRDRFRVNGNIFFCSFPGSYWGIGYEMGRDDGNKQEYKRLESHVQFDFLCRVAGYLYAGPNFLFSHVEGRNFEDESVLNGERRRVSSFGLGAVLSYDSRDFIPNPGRGFYVRLEQLFFVKEMGNRASFRRTSVEVRGFRTLWKGGILACGAQGIFNDGDTPWSMVARLGGSYWMRGYYEGRYRDRDLVQAQVELRQKVYRRHGVALWVGAGNVFPKMERFRWSHTLPNGGVGYRWEFKNRINVRLDYGVGKGETGFYFSVNEAF